MFPKLTYCLIVLPLAVAARSNAPSDGIPLSPTSIATPAESTAIKTTPLRRRFDSGLDAGPIDSTSAVNAGLRVIIDPQTHELRDSPANAAQAQQIEDANAQLPRPDYSKMTLETEADGSIVLHNNGQIMMSTSVHLKTDGSYEEICAPSAEALPVIKKLANPVNKKGGKSP